MKRSFRLQIGGSCGSCTSTKGWVSTTLSGEPFPQRDLILFLTFCVILVTLVGQGAVMPAVMRALGLANAGRRERQADRIAEQEARRQAAGRAIELFDRIAADKDLPKPFVDTFRALGLVFLAVLPLLLVMKKPSHQGGAGAAMH